MTVKSVNEVAQNAGMDELAIGGFVHLFLDGRHPELIPEFETFLSEILDGDDRVTACPHFLGLTFPPHVVYLG